MLDHADPAAPVVDSRSSRAANMHTLLARLLACDFTRPIAALCLLAVVVLSRMPWITLGYGSDPDASRVAISARWWWDHGEFYPSRLPGYPLYEMVQTALYPLGATVMNLSTLLVACVGLALFAAIAKRLCAPVQGLLTVTFAFAPMIWINSSITMDYLWGVTFILATYLALLRGAPNRERTMRRDRSALLAGLLFGVAMGCRPTSALFALPFLVLLVRERRLRPLVLVFGVAGLTAFVAFLPLLLPYRLSFLNFFDVRPTWHAFARTLGVEAFGLIPAVGLLLTLAVSWRRLARLPHLLRRDVQLAVCVLAMLLVFMSFLRLPLEEAYLVPALPFALVAAARVLSRPALVAVCLLLVGGGLLDFHTTSTQGWRQPLAAIAGIRPQKGRVLIDRELRVQRLKIADGMRAMNLPERSVITAGFYYPIFVAKYGDDLDVTLPKGFRRSLIGPLTDGSEARDRNGVVYVWLMKPGDARRYREQGYRTFTMDLDSADVLVPLETYLPEHERFAVR